MLDFVEPASSDVILKASQTLWPVYAKAIRRNLFLQVSEEVLSIFRALKDRPVLICPNHSAHEDPAVMFILSTMVNEQFRFLTARESFGSRNTWYSKWLQKIGCYSVERGVPDVHAFRATRDLLIQGPNKIVIFPEGEVTHQNNYLNEFENGTEHIGLSAVEELKREHRCSAIFIVPLALKYKYVIDVRQELAEAIGSIEAALGYESALGYQKDSGQFLKERIRSAFFVMLAVLESAHNCSPPPEASFEERMTALRAHLICETECFLHVELPKDLPQLHKIHMLKNNFAQKSWCHEDKPKFVHFRCSHCPSDLERIYYRQLKRATNFLALGNHSFNHELTQEEAAELISILQQEILGKVSLKRPETIFIGAAPAIDLNDFSAFFEKDKKSSIQAVKLELAHRLNERLLTLEENERVVPASFKNGLTSLS